MSQSRSFVFNCLNSIGPDPTWDYCNQPYHAEFEVPQPERQRLQSYADDLLVYYKRVHHRIHALWLQHYPELDAQDPTRQGSAYQCLHTLASPERIEITLKRDVARAKEGDRLALNNERNTFAFYIYTQGDELWVTRYEGDSGYGLPEEAAPLFKAYNAYAFLADHQTYGFRDVLRENLDRNVEQPPRT